MAEPTPSRAAARPRRIDRAPTHDFGVVAAAAVDRGSGSPTTAWLRKARDPGVLALVWELYARWLDNPLLFPTFTETRAGLRGTASSTACCSARAWTSLHVLLIGYAAGIALAAVLHDCRDPTRIGTDLLER